MDIDIHCFTTSMIVFWAKSKNELSISIRHHRWHGLEQLKFYLMVGSDWHPIFIGSAKWVPFWCLKTFSCFFQSPWLDLFSIHLPNPGAEASLRTFGESHGQRGRCHHCGWWREVPLGVSATGLGGGGIWVKMRINLNNVGKTIISHPPNHNFYRWCKTFPVMGGLSLFYTHFHRFFKGYIYIYIYILG